MGNSKSSDKGKGNVNTFSNGSPVLSSINKQAQIQHLQSLVNTSKQITTEFNKALEAERKSPSDSKLIDASIAKKNELLKATSDFLIYASEHNLNNKLDEILKASPLDPDKEEKISNAQEW